MNHRYSVSLCFVSILMFVGVMGSGIASSALTVTIIQEQVVTVEDFKDFKDEDKAEIPRVFFNLLLPENSPVPQNYEINITALVDHDFIHIKNVAGNRTLSPEGKVFSFFDNLELTAVGIQRTLTGDLYAIFSCSSNEEGGICDDSVVSASTKIYTEKKKLKISSTHEVINSSMANNDYNVTVSVSKDLATLESLDVRVTLTSLFSRPDTVITKDVRLGSPEGSNGTVLFASIPTDVYDLNIECVSSSFCESLKPWIEFPQQNRVEAHESYQILVGKVKEADKSYQILVGKVKEANKSYQQLEQKVGILMDCLELKCGVHGNCTESATACECETGWHGNHCDEVNPTTTPTESPSTMITATPTVYTTTPTVTPTVNATTPTMSTTIPTVSTTSDNSETSPPTTAAKTKPAAASSSGTEVTTELEIPEHVLSTHMEVAVGALIAVLVLSLLGYLLYQYRVQVKEWVCSKKNVVSNLPRSLPRRIQRNSGGKYTKLPRTMQEALHQD